ncbi:MAG: TolC family protein [Aliarcobacter sp.]|nr:TolC family protein [Aliarcobacter sp.]
MKKIKFITLSLAAFLAVNLNALTLDEAVNKALETNFDIQGKNYDYIESLENVKLNNSNYLPKLDASYGYTNTHEANVGFNTDDATASLKLSYNLFNGFKDLATKESSKYLSLSSQYALNATKQDIVLDTKTAYINYLDKQNALETYNSAYVLFQEQFEDSQNRYDQGLIAKNDLLQVQVNMSSAKQNVVKAQGDLKVALWQLSNILGGMNLQNETIEKLNEQTSQSYVYDEKLLENRSEIQALNMNLQSIKELEKSAKSGYYPKVDASVSHNQYFDGVSKKVEDKEDNQNIANITASWNLYNGGYDSSLQTIYKTKYLSATSLLNKTKLDIKLQYENAKSNYDVANENLETSKLALLQAQENYSIVKNRFDEGIATSTDLTDANYLLTQAKQGFYRAYFDKYLAISTLDRVFEKDKY